MYRVNNHGRNEEKGIMKHMYANKIDGLLCNFTLFGVSGQ